MVKKYQEKKLAEANQKLQFHIETKNQLEAQLPNFSEQESIAIKEKIEKQKKYIEIWLKNIKVIKKELQKLKS